MRIASSLGVGFIAAIFLGSLAPGARVWAETEPTAAREQRILDARASAAGDGVGIVEAELDGDKTTIRVAGATAPFDEKTLFEIGSVTKTFTATLLASMVLDGSVKLDDPVGSYLPKRVRVPSLHGRRITLLDLATQRSGLPTLPTNLDAVETEDPYADYSVDRLYAFLDGYRLTREPGARFEYSNLGIGLLGIALANRAHRTYAELLQERVLDPLGMHDTVVAMRGTETQETFATGHASDGTVAHDWTFDALAPAGAIHSNAADMLKFVRCNLGRGPLAKTCLFAQRPRAKFTGNRIGLLWWTGDVIPIVHHGGDTAGFHASIAIAPDRSKGVVVLANGGTPVEDIAFNAVDPRSTIVAEPEAIALPPEDLDAYARRYRLPEGSIGEAFTIERDGEKLMARLTGQSFARIFPSARDRFFYRAVAAQMDFQRDHSGAIVGLVFHQDGHVLVATKAGVPISAIALPAPTEPPSYAVDAATLASYVGEYVAGPSLGFTVTRAASNLRVKLSRQEAFDVFAAAKDRFYYKAANAQIDFERDAAGAVVALTLHQNGTDLTARKK